MLWACMAIAIRSDEPATYLNRASCASATCHGGIQGQGPAWNSSLRSWEANDVYHTRAGQVLMNEQSQMIVKALTRGSKPDDGATGDSLHQFVLRERCVSCHAPSLAFTSPATDPKNWSDGIRDGVSCEACHGPASGWLTLHTLIEPDPVKLAASGKLATEPWPERADNCLRCHVGSRTQDGLIRDMNHDMIAAGHPPLLFDLCESQLRLPAHWDIAESKQHRVDSRFAVEPPALSVPQQQAVEFELASPSEYYHAKSRALVAVAKLSLERLEASRVGQAPWPELAENNCFACHQSIAHQTYSASKAPQGLTWNTFYTQRVALDLGSLPFGNGLKPLDSAVAELMLTELLKAAESQQFEPVHWINAIRSAADQSIQQQTKPDWQLAVSWLWSNRLMLLNAGPKAGVDQQDCLADKDAAELTALLDEFGRILQHHSSPTSSLMGLTRAVAVGPGPNDFESLLRLRDQYRTKVAAIIHSLSASRGAGANP